MIRVCNDNMSNVVKFKSSRTDRAKESLPNAKNRGDFVLLFQVTAN